MPSSDEQGAIDGRAAFERSDWAAALEALRTADSATPLGPDDLERAGLAAMWMGDGAACTDFRQRAFAAQVELGDEHRAAGLALDLCLDHARKDRMTVARGWFERAERLLDGDETGPELGRLVAMRASIALAIDKDPVAALAFCDDALRIGRECHDADLIATTLATKGTVLVRLGDVTQGLRHVDEAMIDAVSGRLGGVAVAHIYCETISLCQALGDLRRASEWTDEAVACSSRPGMGDFPGECKMHRAEITRLRGDWAGAESELNAVMADLGRWSTGHVGQTWYELGEIALRRGDLAAAAVAFDQAWECGKDPQPGLAMLRLAQGTESVASALLRAAVANAGDGDPLAVGQLLPAVVEVQIACGDVDGAADASKRLDALAQTYTSVLFEARAATSRAQVALARGDARAAATLARTAVNLWRDAGAPFEAAQAQHLLAEAAARVDDREIAIVELDAALAVLTGLGAARDVEVAQRLRDRLGDPGVGHQVRRTFMFTDIVDSTRLVAAMGDQRWATVLRWHDRTIRDLLAQHRGSEVKQRGGGDGFFAVFDAPRDAVTCAIAMQSAFAAHREDAGFAPEIRIGVHEADALASGGDYAGLGVHEAARIAGLAGSGEILASSTTVAAAGARTAGPPRAVAVKGLDARLSVQAVRWRTGGQEDP